LLFALIVDRRLLLLIGIAILGALAVPSIMARVQVLFTSSYQYAANVGGRGYRWDFGLELWKNGDQWLGYGLGRFGGATAMNNQVDETMKYFYIDNYYIKTLVEMGWAGILSFAALLATAATRMLRAVFVGSKTKANIALPAAILCGTAGVMLHCYFENIFEVPYMVAYFWGLIAVACRWPALWKQDMNREGSELT